MTADGCFCCIAGYDGDKLCQKCFMLWYDSGINVARWLAREARWRKAEDYWLWGDKIPRLAQIEEMEQTPLPEDKKP
jgi:hypothetical protein